MFDHTIVPAGIEDLPIVYRLFEEAIAFQERNGYKGWKQYDKDFIKRDVEKQLLYKVLKPEGVGGIFCICLSDELIWRDMENGDALYLHRLVVNQALKGEKLFQIVFEWANDFAKSRGLKSIRMDTWADNARIIAYYQSYGFTFVENYTTPDTTDLPVQHRNLRVALLEYSL